MNALTPVLPRVASGDPAAIGLCIDRYSGLVWSLAKRRFSDTQTAEDAVQDVFIQLWQVAEKFDPAVASESTFVAMIARRRLIDRYRKLKSQPKLLAADESLESVVDSDPSAAAKMELNEEAQKAEQFLSELPQEQQQVIRLSVYDGLSHSHIAKSTGLSLGTVKTHIRRGIMKLREQLFPVALLTAGGGSND